MRPDVTVSVILPDPDGKGADLQWKMRIIWY